MKREAVVAVLVSEGPALVSVSARTASSVAVVPTPTDPMGFCKRTRDLKARERDTLSEAVVSSRTLVKFVTWFISRTEFSSSELVL